MADQRTDVQSVRAGGNVTVAPVQIVDGATGSAVRGWTEALLRGPLTHAGLSARAEEAQRLREAGDPALAADEFEGVAQGLVDSGYEEAAETYFERAAGACAEAGNRGRARELYLRLARRTLGDGSLDAQGHARRARDLSSGEAAWEADALSACAAWPEREHQDLAAVRLAWEKTRGTEEEVEWASRFVELAILTGEAGDEALQIAAATRERNPLQTEHRLSLELDFLDLIEDDPERVDSEWAGLSSFLSDPRLSVEASGTAWQRRGVALARRGLPDEAHAAFLQAVSQWARLPGYDDQAAEAYFSGLSAQLALGDFSAATDTAARSLARTLRGSRPTETASAERLLRRGMRALVNEKFPDAFRLLSVALSTARRAGNLSDFLEAAEALGDCLAATGKHGGAALLAYVQGGSVTKAKKVTQGAMVDDVLTIVSLSGPRWERAAAWAAVAGCERTLSDAAASTVTECALAEQAVEPAQSFPTNAAYFALAALASAICAVPEARRDEVLTVLRDRLARGLGDPGALHEPFQMVTRARIADETTTLVDAMLADAVARPRGPELADVLEDKPEQRARIVAAARDGHSGALKALAFSDDLADDAEVAAQATRRVEAAIAAPLRDVQAGGVGYGIGESMAAEGIYARGCPAPTRDAFVGKMLETLKATDLPLMTRVGAVEALQNLAPALATGAIEEVVASLGALALADDVPGAVDQFDSDEPLARFKITTAQPHILRGAAVEALSVVAKHGTEGSRELVRRALAPALASGEERLVLAALRALSNHPDLRPEGLDLRLLAGATWPSVRVATLAAMLVDDLDGAAATSMALLNDPSPYVRRQLVNVAVRLGERGEPLRQALLNDPDCFIRALAVAGGTGRGTT